MRLLVLFFCGLLLNCPAGEVEPVRLAIFADSEHRSAADLLMAKLSADSRVVLVERSEIQKVVDEQHLALAGLTHPQVLTLGKLLNADGIVLFRTIASPDGHQLQVAMIAVQSGAILASYNNPIPKAELALFVDAVTARVLRALPKFTLKEQDVVKLSVVNFRALQGGAQIAPPFTKLITAALSDSSELIVLERTDLRRVAKEKDLAAERSPFWAGTYLLRGTVERNAQDENGLKVVLEIIAPGKSEGAVYTIEGSRGDLAALAAKSAEAVNAHFNKPAGPTEGWQTTEAKYFMKESEYFLSEAELAFLKNKEREPWIHAYAAWSLGLRDPRLGEILLNLHLEKNGRIGYGGDSRSPHFTSHSHPLFQGLWSLVELASHFDHNPKYWRGMSWFWFPEGLDEVEDIINYYRTIAKAAETDPKWQKINEEGNLAVEVLLAASLPHLLICREPEGEKYRPRLQAMAAELRALYDEMLRSNLSAKQKERLIKLHAAMVPFWANEGDMKASVRQVLASYPTPEEFAERAAAHMGIITGFFIASEYGRHLDLARPLYDLKWELLAAKQPEDQLVGEYILFHSKELPLEDISGRRACLERIFQHMEAIMPAAEKAPDALGTYLVGIQMLFEKGNWANRTFLAPHSKNSQPSTDPEGLANYLTRRLAWKYQLFFIDHWPAGYRGDLCSEMGPFGYWTNAPGANFPAIEKLSKEDIQDLKDYYLPLVDRYLTENSKPIPYNDKLSLLSSAYHVASKRWPEILPGGHPRLAPPRLENAPKIKVLQKWSLQEQFKKLTGIEAEDVRGRILDSTYDRITVLATGGGIRGLFDIHLPDFSTTLIRVPFDASETTEGRPSGMVRDDRFTYLFGPLFGLLRYDAQSGEWKSLAPFTARSGFNLNGKFYFANDTEFYALNAQDEQSEVFVSLNRSPALSPLDNANLKNLLVRKFEEDFIEVSTNSAPNEQTKRIVYQFDPHLSQWTLLSDEMKKGLSRVRGYVKNLRGLIRAGPLLYSPEPTDETGLMNRGIPLSIEPEGLENADSGAPNQMAARLLTTNQGFVLLNFRQQFRKDPDLKLWYLSFEAIDDYLQNARALPNGSSPTPSKK